MISHNAIQKYRQQHLAGLPKQICEWGGTRQNTTTRHIFGRENGEKKIWIRQLSMEGLHVIVVNPKQSCFSLSTRQRQSVMTMVGFGK